MAIGRDRVRPYKTESAGSGGDPSDDDAFSMGVPQQLRPQEDAIETAGHYLQDADNRDENVYLCRDGDDMCFRDKVITTPVALSKLVRVDPTAPCQVLWSEDGVSFVPVVPLNFLVNDQGELITQG